MWGFFPIIFLISLSWLFGAVAHGVGGKGQILLCSHTFGPTLYQSSFGCWRWQSSRFQQNMRCSGRLGPIPNGTQSAEHLWPTRSQEHPS